MMLSDTTATIPIEWLVSGIAAALAIGIAWGTLNWRVKAVEAMVKALGRQLDRLSDELSKLREALTERRP